MNCVEPTKSQDKITTILIVTVFIRHIIYYF